MFAPPRCPPILLSSLASVALLGCFSDGEGMSSGNASTAESEATGETSNASATSTSGATNTGTTTDTGGDETSSSSPSTTDPTTDPTTGPTTDPTTGPTTDPTTDTTDPTGCRGPCQPGEVDVGDECGSCGLSERTCDDQCEWGPTTCVEHLETCGFWRLPEGASAWERHPLYEGEEPAHAPGAPILAAFDISARDEGFVLTTQGYHVIDTKTLTWIRSGSLAEDFPSVVGKNILAAYATPDGEAGNMPTGRDGIAIFTPSNVYLYELTLASGAIKETDTVACCDDQWKSPQAPETAEIRAFWIALDDADPWGDYSLAECEGAPPGSTLDWYGAAITDNRVHLQNIGTCFDFVVEMPFSSWHPFDQAGGPADANEVGAGFLNGGDVWIFRGP